MLKKLFKGLGFLFLGLVGLGILGAMLGEEKEEGSPAAVAPAATAAPAAPPPPAPALAVSASELFNDYHDNEVAADQKYKGKRLAVTGTVQSIEKDLFDNIVVRLRTSNEFMGAMASLDSKYEALAASLRKGAKVAWTCKGGGLVVGSPVLRDCAPSAS